jgi:hypothetical protein
MQTLLWLYKDTHFCTLLFNQGRTDWIRAPTTWHEKENWFRISDIEKKTDNNWGSACTPIRMNIIRRRWNLLLTAQFPRRCSCLSACREESWGTAIRVRTLKCNNAIIFTSRPESPAFNDPVGCVFQCYRRHRARWLKGYSFWIVFGRCPVRTQPKHRLSWMRVFVDFFSLPRWMPG